jgi:hypothetical protein
VPDASTEALFTIPILYIVPEHPQSSLPVDVTCPSDAWPAVARAQYPHAAHCAELGEARLATLFALARAMNAAWAAAMLSVFPPHALSAEACSARP